MGVFVTPVMARRIAKGVHREWLPCSRWLRVPVFYGPVQTSFSGR